MLAESNRIKFYQLTPTTTAGNEPAVAQLSPVLQRAVFMSIGRELGWLSAESKPRAGTSAGGHAVVNTVGGVDFVDLRPAKNEAANQTASQPTPSPATPVQPTPAQSDTQPSDAADPAVPALAASAIPAFVSGDKLVVALDPATVSANSSVAFYIPGLTGGTTDGSFVMGNNPAVVSMPYYSGTFYDWGFYLTIGTTTPWGQSNTTQFFVPANP